MTEVSKTQDQSFASALRRRLNGYSNVLMLGYTDRAKRLEYSILVYGVYRFAHLLAMLTRLLIAVNYFQVMSGSEPQINTDEHRWMAV